MILGTVNGQSLLLRNGVVAADTIDYLEAQFVFVGSDWDDLSVIKAVITNTETDVVYAIPLTDGRIRKEDHLNLSAGLWEVHLVGSAYDGGELVERITTVQDFLRVAPCGELDGEPLPEIPATDVERLEAAIEELRQNGGGGGGGSGTDGITPHIGENGNWFIGDEDTGVKAVGVSVANKMLGVTADGRGFTEITLTDGTKITVYDGANGKNGANGTSVTVASVEQSTVSGGENIVTFSDGKRLGVKNGKDGKDGKDGADGYTPQKDVDYFDGEPGDDYILTDEDKTEIAEEAAKLVEVPESSGGVSLGMTGAAVGQIAKITEVNESGVPTGWEPVDLPSGGGWRKIIDYTTEEQVWNPTISGLEFTEDLDGNPISAQNIYIKLSGIITGGKGFRISLNNGDFADVYHGSADTFSVTQGFISHVPGYWSFFGTVLDSVVRCNKVKDNSSKAAVEFIRFSGPNYNAVHLEPGARIEVWGMTSNV